MYFAGQLEFEYFSVDTRRPDFYSPHPPRTHTVRKYFTPTITRRIYYRVRENERTLFQNAENKSR